jgi:hypothetical protein
MESPSQFRAETAGTPGATSLCQVRSAPCTSPRQSRNSSTHSKRRSTSSPCVCPERWDEGQAHTNTGHCRGIFKHKAFQTLRDRREDRLGSRFRPGKHVVAGQEIGSLDRRSYVALSADSVNLSDGPIGRGPVVSLDLPC